jgi:hypothetical protein
MHQISDKLFDEVTYIDDFPGSLEIASMFIKLNKYK